VAVEGIRGGKTEGAQAVIAEGVDDLLPTGQADQDEHVRGVIPQVLRVGRPGTQQRV
jgi:hypothetical protein